MVSEEDKRRMRRLAEDLKEIESDQLVSGEGFVALIEWTNLRRAEQGIPLLESRIDTDPAPEEEFFKRARALGMVRGRRRDP